jgi:hypothetical protein
VRCAVLLPKSQLCDESQLQAPADAASDAETR